MNVRMSREDDAVRILRTVARRVLLALSSPQVRFALRERGMSLDFTADSGARFGSAEMNLKIVKHGRCWTKDVHIDVTIVVLADGQLEVFEPRGVNFQLFIPENFFALVSHILGIRSQVHELEQNANLVEQVVHDVALDEILEVMELVAFCAKEFTQLRINSWLCKAHGHYNLEIVVQRLTSLLLGQFEVVWSTQTYQLRADGGGRFSSTGASGEVEQINIQQFEQWLRKQLLT